MTIIPRVQRVLQLLRRAILRGQARRMRPKADILAEVRDAVETQAPARCSFLEADDREPLRGAGRSARPATSPALLEAIHDVDGHRAGFASLSPHPRHVPRGAFSWTAMARLPKICPAPASAGAVGVDARSSTRCGGATRATVTLGAGRASIRRHAAGRGAVDRYDHVGFPGETDADFEDTAVADARTRSGYHAACSRSSIPKAAEHARRPADVGRCRRGREDATDRGAARRCSAARSRPELNACAARPGRWTCWSTPRAGAAAGDGAVRCHARAATSSSTCRGRRHGSARRFGCASSAPDRTACGVTATPGSETLRRAHDAGM